jgi:hypothetical protein
VTSSSPDDLRALGEYDVLAPIGRGGMAEVHAARLRGQPDRLVALKVIRPELGREQGFVAMFLDEARIASRLSHPNIVSIYGLGRDAGRHYLAMELLRGRTLLELWVAANARGKKVPFAIAAWIGARIAGALHYAHELSDEAGSPAQVVHRDVNPSNIFICVSGEPKVIDFGLAKAKDRIAATAIGVVKGKLAYLSPEQVAGKPIDRRSDIFSLGVTLWEVTVGRRLFREDDDVATVRRVLAADVPDPTTLVAEYPPALAAVLGRALEPDPMNRFASAGELGRALDGFVEDAGGCNAAAVAALFAELFPPSSPPAWEAIVFPHGPQERGRASAAQGSAEKPGSVRVWDDDAQKMTWMAATAETMVREAPSHAAERATPRTRAQEIDDALAARIAAVPSDPAALAQAHLERSLADELLGDGEAAVAHAQAALGAMDFPAPHAVLRRLLHARGAEQTLLVHQAAELAAAVGDQARADRWAERGRLLRAAGEQGGETEAAFERALASVAGHPAALRGLEGELWRAGGEERGVKLAGHLARMAEAYADDTELAAWLHVERAELLGATDVKGAREALERALALAPETGAVRKACIAHAAEHREWAWLADLLDAEAEQETSATRAAALELDAACIHRLALALALSRATGRSDRAIALLERAAARAPTEARVDARVAGELVLLHEWAGNDGAEARPEQVLRARRRRLAFIEGGRARAGELRTIAALEESRGDTTAAIATLREARKADPSDARATETLDRLLAAASLTGERIALLIDAASRAAEGTAPAPRAAGAERDEGRAGYLLRASSLAEEQGDTARAIELARACLVAKPADQAAVDALCRLLASVPTDAQVAEARARIAVHAHAAEHATDPARRVAHLETVALLTEEMLGAPALAAKTYEAILALEPQRRGALLGLARTARRAGDVVRHVRALLDEAAITSDPRAADALRAQAAEVLAASNVPSDRDRALGVVSEILARDPAHAAARRIEQRLHETAQRWGEVDRGLLARIESSRRDDDKAALLAARAELLQTRLRDPEEALRALREAFALAPGDEDLRGNIVSLLEARGDARLLKEGLVELAEKAASPIASADALVRAAEIDELVLGDDASAGALLDRAIALQPEDAAVAERRARIQLRANGRARAAPSVDDCERARAADPRAAHALRGLEAAARRDGLAPRLANALAAQAEAWSSTPARLGALYGLLDLIEWTLPPSDPAPVLDAILALAPDDVAALDARVRCTLVALVRNRDGARAQLDPLRRRVASAADRTDRVLARLALALALDPDSPGSDDLSLREALGSYKAALAEAPGSIIAAHGSARLGARFDDEQAYVAGTRVLADVAPPAERAVRLTQAAGKLLASRDGHFGTPAARLERAFDWLEAALEANPDAVLAAALLVGARTEETHRDRLIAVLRRALERATTREAKVQHGTELARVARLDPPDRVLAVEALRHVVTASPGLASAWRALADVALEQGATAEAEAALESLVTHARDPRSRLAALFDLAELYRRRSGGATDVERVLRAALDTDPTSERAVRELLAVRRAEAPREEQSALLARLAEAVHGAEAKATVLGELADAHVAAGDAAAAEQALIEAAATAPNAARLARLLARHAASPAEQARVLAATVARGEALGRADPAMLVRLGRLEIEALARPADGVVHLRRALALSPTLHDARATLARGLVEAGGGAEAIAMIASMMLPDASPLLSLPDPAAVLATLERAFAGEGQPDEALVARELRVIGGGLDDGAHVELRARRLAPGTLDRSAGSLDEATLLATVAPPELASLAFALAQALEGVETKITRTDLDALGTTARARLPAAQGDPLHGILLAAAATAAALGIDPPPLAVSDRVPAPRVALVEGVAWVVAPTALPGRAPPEQLAALARPLVRIALGVGWIDELTGADTHALLIAAARRVVRDYAAGRVGADVEERAVEMTKRVARVLGPLAFRQKKALGDLAGRLAAEPPVDARAVAAFALAIARTELRAAFLLSGDLLATLDSLRASDPAFGRETDRGGPRALAAALAHPSGLDLVRFAMSRQTTALRKRLGTSWSRQG